MSGKSDAFIGPERKYDREMYSSLYCLKEACLIVCN